MLRSRSHIASDPLANCAIVVDSLLREMELEERDETAKTFAETLLRVLDRYKFGVLRQERAHYGVLRRAPMKPRIKPDDGHDDKVIEAFDRTRGAIFPRLNKNQVVAQLTRAIRGEFDLVSNVQVGPQHQRDRRNLQRFLERLGNELEA
jgi:hypothetical protein